MLDPETSECLHYEAVTGYPPKKYANIPREVLTEHPEVDIRNDLIDCSIDVCSVEASPQTDRALQLEHFTDASALYCRSRHYSRTTLTMETFGETLFTGSSHLTYL